MKEKSKALNNSKKFNCISCGNSLTNSEFIELNNIPNSAQGFYNLSVKEKVSTINTRLIECNYCKLIQLETKPVSYYKEVQRSTSVSVKMQEFRESQFQELKNKYFSNLKDVRVLEVGSASGDYAMMLKKVFHNVTTTEKDNNGRDYQKGKGINCINTHPDESDFIDKLGADSSFDLICCFSYLEHLPDPQNALKKFNKLIKDNGILMIEVPNSEFIFRNGLLNEIIPDHLCYYTPNTICKLLDNSRLFIISFNSSE